VWGDGKQMVKGDIFDYFGIAGKNGEELVKAGYIVWTPVQPRGSFLGEGDTGTFLNLIDNGLRGYRDESFGGWGGVKRTAPLMAFGAEAFAMMEQLARNPAARKPPPRGPTQPFLAAVQRDFAARLVWATTSDYAKANHNPRINARGSRLIDAKPGQPVRLSVITSDPDKDTVSVRWWRWDDADSYDGVVKLNAATGTDTGFTVPNDVSAGQTIDIIAEATDAGEPALTRYERFIVTVR
jgi:hypothetical protein